MAEPIGGFLHNHPYQSPFPAWVLSSKEINIPYPLGLTLLHMVFPSLLCFLLTKVFKVMKVEDGMMVDIYITSVIPVGAILAMTLWLGNTSYLYISVAFAQMLKAIKALGYHVQWSCLSDGWIGFVYQMGGFVGEALRLIFMEIFVKKQGLKLNHISILLCEPLQGCTSLDSALCLFVPWIFLERPKMDANGTWHFQPIILMLNSLCTFDLNLSVFLVITCTSALTIRVAGVVKDWVVVLVSALLFADTKLTMINLVGYGIAISGVAAYDNHKLKKEASGSGPSNEQQCQCVQLTSTSTSDK